MQHAPQPAVVPIQTVVVGGPVIVAHQEHQREAGGGLVEPARELDQEPLEEDALVLHPFGAHRVGAEIAADHHRARPARGDDRHELLVERALAMEVGGEEPIGHAGSRRRDKFRTSGLAATARIYPSASRARNRGRPRPPTG